MPMIVDRLVRKGDKKDVESLEVKTLEDALNIFYDCTGDSNMTLGKNIASADGKVYGYLSSFSDMSFQTRNDYFMPSDEDGIKQWFEDLFEPFSYKGPPTEFQVKTVVWRYRVYTLNLTPDSKLSDILEHVLRPQGLEKQDRMFYDLYWIISIPSEDCHIVEEWMKGVCANPRGPSGIKVYDIIDAQSAR